jgi:anti-sigma B factor antagonist
MTHSISSDADPAGHVVAVSGEADATAAPALDDAVQAAVRAVLEAGAERTIIIDLTETTFIDSRTIGVLATWVEELGAKGWRVPIVCTDSNLLRLFGLIGLEQTFDFFPTRAAAADAS